LADPSDETLLIDWLLQPGVLRWFPLTDLREVEDAARIWMSYISQHAVLTAVYNGVPCGSVTLYLQPYQKLAHQSLLAIIVDEKYRGRGIGTLLIKEIIRLSQERFHLDFLHLEVYEGNPAIRLYHRLGFKEYGVHNRFIKESNGQYLNKILMQRGI
jgi:putative acetyltransferase